MVIYGENDILFTLQKIASILLKNRCPLAISVSTLCHNILTFPQLHKDVRSCNYLWRVTNRAIIFSKFLAPVSLYVATIYPCLALISLVIPGYPWLSLVFLG